MKVLTFGSLLLATSMNPVMGCLLVAGEINDRSSTLVWAFAIDNGDTVCNFGKSSYSYHIDQDGHYSLGCKPGYVYAVDRYGLQGWFQNPAGNTGYFANQEVNIYLDRGVRNFTHSKCC